MPSSHSLCLINAMILHPAENDTIKHLHGAPISEQPQGARRMLAIAAAIFLVAWSASYLIRGIAAGVWFDGSPADGPFSMFNALRRIDAGQTLGLEIRSYLGVGVPLLHYPLFVALGRTVNGSEITRQLLAFFAYLLPLMAFFYAACRRFHLTLVLTVFSTLILEAFFHNIAGPANSMIVVRAMMPLFIFAIWLTNISDSLKAVLIGLSIAVAFLLGFEQSIALTLAFTTVTLIKAVATKGRDATIGDLKFLLTVLVTAVAGSAALLVGLCGIRGARAVLQFFLVDLPADKFWYDGSPPNPFLGSWKELITSRHHLFPFLPVIAGAVLLCIFVFRGRAGNQAAGKQMMARDWRLLAMVMLSYGIISSVNLLGMLGIHYTVPLCRVLVLVLLLAALRSPRRFSTLPDAASYAFAAVCIAAGAWATVPALAAVKHPARPFVYSANLSPAWDQYMADAVKIVDTNRQRPGPLSLWSTYAGLLESRYRIFNPIADYMVVEVGAQRRKRYFAEFARIQPEFVQTIAPSYFVYEEWLQNVDWPFYEAVLNNYQIVGQTGHSLLWHRKPEPWGTTVAASEALHVDPACRCIPVPASLNGERVGIVTLRYIIHNPWHRFPLLGMTPRYLLTPEGTPRHIPVSLPPYETVLRFPVEIPAGKSIRLGLETKTLLPGADFEVSSVVLERLRWESSQRAIVAP